MSTPTWKPMSDTRVSISCVCEELNDLLLRKNKDYGDSAFKSPVLTPGIAASVAQRVRMSDKIERLTNLLSRESGPAVADESLVDTFLDLAGYCVLQVIELRREVARLPVSPNEELKDVPFIVASHKEMIASERKDRPKSTNASYQPEE